MKQFAGFPARAQYTSIANIFFSELVPKINDIIELKVTLHLFQILYAKRGYPRFVSLSELLGNPALAASLPAAQPEEALRSAIFSAVERGTFLHLVLAKNDKQEDIYVLNNDSNRQIINRVAKGEMHLSGLRAEATAPFAGKVEQSDIFTIYEENIGLMTPMMAYELIAAEKLYTPAWITEAIKEAVSLNKRNWRYISRILERWASEGKNNGIHRGHPAPDTDPDKYIKGKYGHLVQR